MARSDFHAENAVTTLTSPNASDKVRRMSIWTRITEALSALTSGEGLAAVFDRLRSPPERSVAFTIAVIALGAKMAKADGLVTRDEVTAGPRPLLCPARLECRLRRPPAPLTFTQS